MGIEPTSSAWEAEVMPLYDTRAERIISSRVRSLSCVQRKSIHLDPPRQNPRPLNFPFSDDMMPSQAGIPAPIPV